MKKEAKRIGTELKQKRTRSCRGRIGASRIENMAQTAHVEVTL